MIDAFKSTWKNHLLLLMDCSEDQTEDIRIKYSSCWDVLDKLKVDSSKRFFVILRKSNRTQPERIDEIANALGISNPIVISSNTGYGIHKLKTMIGSHLIKLAIDIPNSRKE